MLPHKKGHMKKHLKLVNI